MKSNLQKLSIGHQIFTEKLILKHINQILRRGKILHKKERKWFRFEEKYIDFEFFNGILSQNV